MQPTQPQPTPQSHRAILEEMIALGADLARHIHAQATAPHAAHPAPQTAAINNATNELALAFERVTRATRRAIHLAHRLDTDQATEQRQRRRTAARKRIIRDIQDTILRTATPQSQPAAHQALRERLDSPDLDDEIEDRPIGDIVKDIARDLGLADLPGAPPWTRRTATDIGNLHAAAAAQGPAPDHAPPHAPVPPPRQPTYTPKPPARAGNPWPGITRRRTA